MYANIFTFHLMFIVALKTARKTVLRKTHLNFIFMAYDQNLRFSVLICYKVATSIAADCRIKVI